MLLLTLQQTLQGITSNSSLAFGELIGTFLTGGSKFLSGPTSSLKLRKVMYENANKVYVETLKKEQQSKRVWKNLHKSLVVYFPEGNKKNC